MQFRNTYDSDNTVFSPQGRLHQVEYALEAVKQGSAAVGLRSKTHAILLALKVSNSSSICNSIVLMIAQRSTGELASYQQKMFRIDDHVGIAIAGLTSDARVLRYDSVVDLDEMLDLVLATSCDNKLWESGWSSTGLCQSTALYPPLLIVSLCFHPLSVQGFHVRNRGTNQHPRIR